MESAAGVCWFKAHVCVHEFMHVSVHTECLSAHLKSVCGTIFVSVCVCGLVCYSEPLGCLSRVFTSTTGAGKRVRMKGGDPGREGRMEAQRGEQRRRWKRVGGRSGSGEGEGQSPGVRCCQDNSQRQHLLQRTKQSYLREQKSANTCLGGSS